MKKIIIPVFVSCVALFLASCRKWLDVQPASQVKSSELFSSEAGFKEALAGVYTILAEDSLYGKELTYGMMGVLSQEWDNTPSTYSDDATYSYSATYPETRIGNVWSRMYSAIANVNNILGNIDADKSVFSGDNYSIIKGEALALRGFIHFDLLRCFGQSYVANPSQPSIPYVTKYTSKQTTQYTVDEVVRKVLTDLDSAHSLLTVDPIYTGTTVSEEDDNGYLLNRQLHLNYYAVEGLLARVYLYMQNYTKARTYAQDVVSSGKFSFSTQTNLINGDDLSGAPEQLFGLQVTELEQNSVDYLSDEGSSVFSLNSASLLSYYESNTDDYRFLYLFANGTGTNIEKRFLLKYSASASDDTYYQKKMPVLKLSEMYYIMAECDYQDNTSVLNDVNPVRVARGIAALRTTPVDFRSMMTTEFRKEFIGEGQLFYYYKRLNLSNIEGSDLDLVNTKAYVFPLPEAEYESGDRESNR